MKYLFPFISEDVFFIVIPVKETYKRLEYAIFSTTGSMVSLCICGLNDILEDI